MRQGAVLKQQLEAILQEYYINYTIDIVLKRVIMHSTNAIEESEENSYSSKVDLNDLSNGEVAPGQAITHYAPDIPCVIATSLTMMKKDDTDSCSTYNISYSLDVSDNSNTLDAHKENLEKFVMVDMGGAYKRFSHMFLAYRDLSITGDAKEAARNLFSSLRWAESILNADLILLPHIRCQSIDSLYVKDKSLLNEAGIQLDNVGNITSQCDLSPGLADRIFRAASGKFMHVNVYCPPSEYKIL